MLNIEILLITIIFVLLVIIAYSIKVSKAVYPLTFLYITFTFYFSISQNKSENKTLINKNNPDNSRNIEKYLKTDDEIFKNKNSKPVPINLTDKSLKPKPLIFESNKIEKNYKLESFSENITIKDNKDNEKDIVLLKEIKICRSIKDRNPVGISKSFNNKVDSLYCYTKIQNNGEKKEIRHVWYFKNEIKTQIKYNIRRSNVYRSWTLKKINPNQIGEWKVEIQNSNGQILGSTKFYIKKS
tara:strand:- start:344 stop:1066 length:723 start_codon:yes stop_codon:yes gene_type:complete